MYSYYKMLQAIDYNIVTIKYNQSPKYHLDKNRRRKDFLCPGNPGNI